MARRKISGEIKRIGLLQSVFNKDSLRLSRNGLAPRLAISVKDLDDCAVYDFDGKLSLVVGSDFVRGTGFNMFRMGYMNYYDIGYYLVIANLSDIAAMGAEPIGITTIIRYTKDLTDEQFLELTRGIHEAARKYTVPVIGGDIGGYEESVLSATALGITDKGRYLLRRNVKKDDLLCVTGYIGIAETALAYFKVAKPAGLRLDKKEERVLIESWSRPEARVKEGLLLSRSGIGHGCQDISDGLKQTIIQMSEASNLSFEIFEDQLPIHSITMKVAGYLNANPTHLAMSNSVDFQLLFSISPRDLERCRQLFTEEGLSFTVIGKERAHIRNKLKQKDGKLVPLPGFVWNQNFRDVTSQVLRQNGLRHRN